MKIKIFQGGFDKNLSYLIWCEITRIAGLIDASVNISEITKYIKKNDLYIEKLFITHTHTDHIYFLKDVKKKYPQIQICGYYNLENLLPYEHRKLKHHDIVTIGSEIITCICTPGHFPDSMCYWNKKNKQIFTGDTMFVGRPGRTIDKKSNIKDLYESIYEKILILPEKTIIYPGHHYGYTKNITLKLNKDLYPFFQCKDKKQFIQVMKNYEKNRLL